MASLQPTSSIPASSAQMGQPAPQTMGQPQAQQGAAQAAQAGQQQAGQVIFRDYAAI
ncbi:hypothetical protein [Wenxinia saemankumensis]|uniref:Uncharacterized protein n=1 Tax=Wenxinia saemankumensis TaxID=1447782 RepID=A0A1M6D5G5_9RHOB|nr:hypothetical protein [Wenxinia saemankumensis]SHI68343.1 hypothetical protein SAMN05444417_1524 [Wenxinia saemankumensis]